MSLAFLATHPSADEKERADLLLMRAWAQQLPAPLSRRQWPAHFTGSALVCDPAGRRACLVLHRALERWLQPGGHVEPEDQGELSLTALREAREETGLTVALHPLAPRPLDVDAHLIPARGDQPAHTHLDVRYAVVAQDPDALACQPSEVSGAQWLTWDQALERADEPALRRLLAKARGL